MDPASSSSGLTRRALLRGSALVITMIAGGPLLAQATLNEGSVAAKVETMRPGDGTVRISVCGRA